MTLGKYQSYGDGADEMMMTDILCCSWIHA